MPEDFKPLLILPKTADANRTPGTPRFSRRHFPSIERQMARLGPVFQSLQETFEARLATLQADAVGTSPEQVLVFETAGPIKDFVVAVRHTPGFEWLAEWEMLFDPDEDFYQEDDRTRMLGGRLFLVMANQEAINQLLSLWNRYTADPNVKFATGLNQWKALFKHLKTIRPWSAQDRLHETGILQEWAERVDAGDENVRFEAEFWYRINPAERETSLTKFREVLSAAGGQALSSCVIDDINYHGALAEIPVGEITNLVDRVEEIQFLKCEQVMFFRPIGQATAEAFYEEPQEEADTTPLDMVLPEPVIALLDGLPMENHAFLAQHLMIDDPDGYAQNYQAQERKHGTWMSSLVIHGEYGAGGEALKRKIYVRPIMKPDSSSFGTPRNEILPRDILPIDAVHRAVRRIFSQEGEQPAVAPTVRIINFSIGDRYRLFDRAMSSWAKLIDWLAWRYNVLFIVSAGNHTQSITIDIPRNGLSAVTQPELEAAAVQAIASDVRNRRLLSPAESINALTVGAAHSDACATFTAGARINPIVNSALPSPCSAIGLGYRRAIKPDILFNGGRQLFLERLGHQELNTILDVANGFAYAPGLKCAGPSPDLGKLSHVHYIAGTSCATALTTHTAGLLFESLFRLRSEPNGNLLTADHLAVVLKALLVHGASWSDGYSRFAEILRTEENKQKFKEFASRFFGFGIVNPARLFECTGQRATLLGCGTLNSEKAHVYSLPLPPSLSGVREWRRLTVTLAWFSPLSPTSRTYRKADLNYEFNKDLLRVGRKEADGSSVGRGTVQHEIFEGGDAVAFVDGTALEIKVNCREDAKKLTEPVDYGLAISLEVAANIQIPVYEEIKSRIRQRILVQDQA